MFQLGFGLYQEQIRLDNQRYHRHNWNWQVYATVLPYNVWGYIVPRYAYRFDLNNYRNAFELLSSL